MARRDPGAVSGYRFYQPDTGRWLSRDPLEEDAALNVYAFVNNSPLVKTDPLGDISIEEIKEVIELLEEVDSVMGLAAFLEQARTSATSWYI